MEIDNEINELNKRIARIDAVRDVNIWKAKKKARRWKIFAFVSLAVLISVIVVLSIVPNPLQEKITYFGRQKIGGIVSAAAVILNASNITEDGYVDYYYATVCPGTFSASCYDYGTQALCNANHGGGGPGGYITCYWSGDYCDTNQPCGASKDTTSTLIRINDNYYGNGDAKGYLSFNTSSIPDGSTITSINFSFFLHFGGGGEENTAIVNVTNMTGKKSSDFPAGATNNQNLWRNISGSFGSLANGSYSMTTDVEKWHNLTLSAGANTYMQNQLSQDYFMFGLISTYQVSIDSKEGTNKPYLTVTYTEGGGDTTVPVVNLTAPANATNSSTSSQTFTANITDNIQISNLTLYIWNSSNSNIYINTTLLNGTNNFTSWVYSLPYNGTFKWNAKGYDNSTNSAWNTNGNFTLIISEAPFSSQRYNWAVWNGTGNQNESVNEAVRLGFNNSIGGFIWLRSANGTWGKCYMNNTKGFNCT